MRSQEKALESADAQVSDALRRYLDAVRGADLPRRRGHVSQFFGLVVEAVGPDAFLGEVCDIHPRASAEPVRAEVVGLKDGRVLLMPYGELRGIGLGCEVVASGRPLEIGVGPSLLGRVVDAFGQPLDGGPKPMVERLLPLTPAPRNPLARARIHDVLETGVKCIDSMLTLGRGQRVGVFSGSGVGKSTLLGMVARNARSDVNVIALIGERGREVLEFIEQSLGPQGLARSVVIVATSDQPALVRSRAALAATAVAEYFCDGGDDVLLIMDSITRFAMAAREIGLTVGEPPTSRGYTPSVFAALPKLLERCGTTDGAGSITALYSVLVEGDDLNDPIADALRALLDGHIVLSRELTERGHFPAIDVLRSASRVMLNLVPKDQMNCVQRAVSHLSEYARNRDMIEIGAYRAGVNVDLDMAVNILPALNAFLRQDMHEKVARSEAMAQLRSLLPEEARA